MAKTKIVSSQFASAIAACQATWDSAVSNRGWKPPVGNYVAEFNSIEANLQRSKKTGGEFLAVKLNFTIIQANNKDLEGKPWTLGASTATDGITRVLVGHLLNLTGETYDDIGLALEAASELAPEEGQQGPMYRIEVHLVEGKSEPYCDIRERLAV